MGLYQRTGCICIRPPLHPSHASFADGRERLYVLLRNICQFEDFCVPLSFASIHCGFIFGGWMMMMMMMMTTMTTVMATMIARDDMTV